MMERLTRSESEVLLKLAHNLVKGDPTSVCAYGSKVAGYARPDSDYDLIVTAKKFPGRIRYRYVDEPVKASALIVEDELLEGDAGRASLGEFVSGRLLNVHQPLLNPEFIRGAEVESKKRVIAEGLLDLSSQYGEFVQNLVVPLDYFLFDKLHKRATMYPPALYSYVRTYTCKYGQENRDASVYGFREAASLLEAEGFFHLEGREVRIVNEKLRGTAFTRLLSLLNLTTRGVKHYAVHGYAGRVGFSVFKDEAVSKVKRMQEKVEPPPELEHPKRLLRLEEGVAFPKTGEMIGHLAASNGLKSYRHKEKSLGEVYSTAKVVTISGSGEVHYVFKHFADIRSMKWAFLNIWSLSRKFSLSPLARMNREYTVSKKLAKAGIATPEIVGAVLDDKVLVKEYVDGKPLSKEVESILRGRETDVSRVTGFGSVLGGVHRAGIALGDTKASNVVVTGQKLFITDLEQAVEGGDQAWDIAEFLYYAGKLSLRDDGIRRVARAFLEGYRGVNGSDNIARARGQKYLAPFRPFVTLQNVKAIRTALEEYSGRATSA